MSAERWLLSPDDALPSLLSDVGVYRTVSDREPYEDLVAYAPNHVLYSNGLVKERQLYLPDGTRIDPSNPDSWDFPVGTVLVKTFVFEGAPIETRLVFRLDDGWDYAIYQWEAGGADAERLEGNWAELTLELGDRGGTHTLPSRLDCRTCHETHESVSDTPVLGFGRFQTDAAAADLDLFTEQPTLASVSGRSEAETAALSYFVGNCTSCHNGGEAINASFSLYPEDAVPNTVNRPTASETGDGIRVIPGNPEQSVLFVTVVEAGEPSYRGPFKVMPPIGVNVTDPDAGEVLGNWIEGL